MKRKPVKVTPGRATGGAKGSSRVAGGLRRRASPTEKVEWVVPVVAEELSVGKRVVDSGGVRITKTVEEQTQTVDEPLARQDVVVRRVPINRPVQAPLPVRQEGEVTIIPVVEEVLVVEKRLVLVEEVHVERKREVRHDPRQIVVRKERAEVERLPGGHPGDASAKS